MVVSQVYLAKIVVASIAGFSSDAGLAGVPVNDPSVPGVASGNVLSSYREGDGGPNLTPSSGNRLVQNEGLPRSCAEEGYSTSISFLQPLLTATRNNDQTGQDLLTGQIAQS